MNEVDSNLAKSRNIFSQLNNKLRQIDDEQWLELKNKVCIILLSLYLMKQIIVTVNSNLKLNI
jgi:hypothetical protein